MAWENQSAKQLQFELRTYQFTGQTMLCQLHLPKRALPDRFDEFVVENTTLSATITLEQFLGCRNGPALDRRTNIIGWRWSGAAKCSRVIRKGRSGIRSGMVVLCEGKWGAGGNF